MKTSTNNGSTIAPAYLRTDDAARYLSIAPRTLRDWMRRGVVAFHKPARKVALFAVADLQKAMQRFRTDAVGEWATT